MPRTAITLTDMTQNAGIDIPVGAAIDQGNGMTIAIPGADTTASISLNQLFLLVQTTNGSDKTVTVKAGVSTSPSTRGGTGDLVVTAHAASGGALIGPLEKNRFAQTDGSVNIDFAAGITGMISAFMWPTRW
jgi:hypothetical protein